MNIALCILTKNEKEALSLVYPTIPAAGPDSGFDVVFALDGGSTDGTVEFFKKNNIPVIGQSKGGRGHAFQIAFEQIEADAYIFFSPDGNEDVNDLKKFRPLLENGADIVIASRMMKGAHNEEDNQILKLRKWANNIFNLMANVVFRREGPFITDSINGYRAITKVASNRLQLDAPDYTIEYQMTIRALKNRLKVQEFATHEYDRVAGESQAKSIPTGLRFIRAFIRELTGSRLSN